MNDAADWPDFPRDGAWGQTRDYLHLVLQMLGKVRVALAPPLPEWFHTSLALTPRGLTTRFIPWAGGSLEANIDIRDSAVVVEHSAGTRSRIPLMPARPVAAIWRDFNASLARLGVDAILFDKPQELVDVVPFADDDRPRRYDPELAVSWLDVLTQIHGVFDEWRSRFFGRSGTQFWWGGFDLAATLFNGKRAKPPEHSNYIQRYDLDAEHATVGFWPGDADSDARFFGYVVPEPPGCPDYDLGSTSVSWAPTFGEWTLDYEDLRRDPNRLSKVREFADTIYAAARDLGGWPMEDFTYRAPPARSSTTNTRAASRRRSVGGPGAPGR